MLVSKHTIDDTFKKIEEAAADVSLAVEMSNNKVWSYHFFPTSFSLRLFANFRIISLTKKGIFHGCRWRCIQCKRWLGLLSHSSTYQQRYVRTLHFYIEASAIHIHANCESWIYICFDMNLEKECTNVQKISGHWGGSHLLCCRNFKIFRGARRL